MPAKLDRLHPDLTAALARILPAMAAFGTPMIPFEGERTLERQQRLHAQGRNGVGKIVTNCDGVKNKSMHQVQPDGLVHAVDCVFLVEGKPSWADTHPWALYGSMVVACGLRWGGKFPSIDSPHAEMPLS
jgi:hypothetical protein